MAAMRILMFIVASASILAAQSLTPRMEGGQLRLSAPRLHFLIGEALARLHNGATVNYEFELTLRTEKAATPIAVVKSHFAVSYDLWEEKFAVTKLEPSPRSVSHLSAAAAEAWCIESLTVSSAGLAPDQPFWIRLDFRADDPSAGRNETDNSSFTLSSLIDIFSRRNRGGEYVNGFEEAGPLRLDRLKKR
jgi:hypothetical protein